MSNVVSLVPSLAHCHHCPSRTVCQATGCLQAVLVQHRDKGDGFTHSDSAHCPCGAVRYSADDPRTMQQIMMKEPANEMSEM
jgi:hypothetical protein